MLLYARRRELGTRWRRLGCFKQALLVFAYLRKNETFAQVAGGFGVSEATAWRYVDETLHSSRPGCPVSVRHWWAWARATSSSLRDADADRPDRRGRVILQYGMNVQAVARPDGTPL
ncbi:hypothetical protein GO001_28075 [Streptomyces sp. NRRL B-1677]|nr:hypothetical protein [Streptomyces sp. NRRL B-1677]